MEENFHSGHVGDVESLEHDVRYALAEHEEDAVSLEHDVLAAHQVQTAETSTW